MRTIYGGRILAKARTKYGKPNYKGRGSLTRNNQKTKEEYRGILLGETHQNNNSAVSSISNLINTGDDYILDAKMNEIWSTIKHNIKDEISPVSYVAWIEPCKLISISENKIVLQVENYFHKELLEKRYLNYLQNTAKWVLNNDSIKVEFIVE